MPVWNMRIFPVASIPFPKGIAIQSIKETTIVFITIEQPKLIRNIRV